MFTIRPILGRNNIFLFATIWVLIARNIFYFSLICLVIFFLLNHIRGPYFLNQELCGSATQINNFINLKPYSIVSAKITNYQDLYSKLVFLHSQQHRVNISLTYNLNLKAMLKSMLENMLAVKFNGSPVYKNYVGHNSQIKLNYVQNNFINLEIDDFKFLIKFKINQAVQTDKIYYKNLIIMDKKKYVKRIFLLFKRYAKGQRANKKLTNRSSFLKLIKEAWLFSYNLAIKVILFKKNYCCLEYGGKRFSFYK